MGKSIFKNTIYSILLRVFNIIIPIIIGAYPLRILGPDLVGRISYSESIYNYFMIFACFGIYNYALREMSKVRNDKKKLNQMFTNMFILGLISHIVVFILYLSYVLLNFNGKPQFWVLIVYGINMIQDIFYIEWVNEALENYDFITMKSIIIRIINIVLLLTLVKSKSDFYIYILLTTFTFIANNFTSFIYIKKRVKFDFSNIQIRTHIKFLVFILLISNANVLYTQLDKLMIGTYNGEAQVAFYNLGQMIITLIHPMLLSVVYVTVPRLSNIVESSEEEYINLLNRVSKYYFAFMFPAAIGLYVLAKEAVLLYVGTQYIAAIPILKVFAIYLITIGIDSLFTNQIIYVRRQERYLVRFLLSCGALNLILKLILLKFNVLTPITAITTTLICNSLLITLEYIFIRKKLKIRFSIFQMDKIKYLFISLIFIPVTMLIKSFVSKMLLVALLGIMANGVIYILILFTIKDEILFSFIKKLWPKKV